MSDGKTIVVITGANTGLGLEIVKALYKSSVAYEIVVGSRDVSKGESAIASVKSETPSSASSLSVAAIDVESDDSIKQFHDHIASKFGRVDALINNAGASFDTQVASGKLTQRQAWNKSWDVNVTGASVLTHEFVDLLVKSQKPYLLFIASGTATLAGTESTEGPMLSRLNGSPEAGWPKPAGSLPTMMYRSSKTGLNMMMREWNRTLKNDGVKTFAISPGMLATGLAGVGADKLREMGALEPSVGGEFIRDVLQGKRDDDQGKVVGPGKVQPW